MLQFIRDAVITLAAVVLVTLALPKSPEYNNNIGYKHHYITHHASDIKTLIIGHSHFENGLNPHLLGDSAFNLASAGRPYYYDIEILREYLPLMPNVKTVLFPLRYCLSDRNFYKARFRQGLFEDYYYGWNMLPPPEYRAEFKRPCKFIPHYRKYQTDRLTADSLGYCPDFSIMALEQRDMSNWEQDDLEKVTGYLEEMAAICKKNQVRFVVLTTPHSNQFLARVTPEGMANLENTMLQVSNLCPVEYHNYMTDADYRSDSLYRDWSHLNSFGADIFTQRVKDDFGL